MAHQRKKANGKRRPCSESERCPFPDLVAYLSDLADRSFQGSINLSFDKGIIHAIKKAEDVEFIRS